MQTSSSGEYQKTADSVERREKIKPRAALASAIDETLIALVKIHPVHTYPPVRKQVCGG